MEPLNYTNCRLCPRCCGVDRRAGQRGFCGMPDFPVAARAAAHYWEEPVISGEYGSGAVFFSGCTLRCKFCQNYEISTQKHGFRLDSRRLREIFERLIQQGCHNINLVTPTHFLPDILPALEPKLPVPVVYNCGGYERVETLRALEGKVDVWLPDMKYADAALARELSDAPDYFEAADAAIREMLRQTGPYRLDEAGLLRRGVLVRHLVLPGHIGNSKDVLEWFAALPKGTALFSLMAQYTPNGFGGPERRLTPEEFSEVSDYMYMLGIRDGYVQELSSAGSEYVPPFDGTGLR